MQLQLTTWPEVEAYLERSRGIIIPIGSTEQHGPTGLIGTDALTAEIIGRRLGETIDALVAPTIAVGMAQHHMAFVGSITFRPSTLIMVVRDIVISLARHGFDHFFFVNGHGGNIAPVGSAFSEIHMELAEATAMRGPGVNKMPSEIFCTLANWFSQPQVRKLCDELYGDKEGRHATPSELSVTWHAYPEQRRTTPLAELVPAKRQFQGASDYRRLHSDGRVGADSSLATPEAGERFVKLAVEDLSDAYRRFLDADSS